MELRDLVGTHLMTGIETGTIERDCWWKHWVFFFDISNRI